MGYKWKYMDETTLDEMEELLKGEHGSTLKLWSLECANATERGIAKSLLTGAGICFAIGIVKAGVKRLKNKRSKEITVNFNLSDPKGKES